MEMEKDSKKYFAATGRRKHAIAQVRIFKGSGKFEILSDTKASIELINEDVLSPLKFVSEEKNFDAKIIVRGGGNNSAREAIKLGLSRALMEANPEYEMVLKKEGFLTRDPREKERKKPGLKRARKAPQWQKR